MKEKKGTSLWRILFCVGALIIDIVMIILTVRFSNYQTSSMYGQIVFKHAWPLAIIPCLAASIVGIILNKEFTAIRAFTIQTILIVLWALWLTFSQGIMLFGYADSGVYRIFSVASICLIAALVFLQLDIILKNPIRRFIADRPDKRIEPNINTQSMSLSEKKSLLKSLNESLKNDRID